MSHGRDEGGLVSLAFHPVQKRGEEREGAHGFLGGLYRKQAGDGAGIAEDGADEAGGIGIADGGLAARLEIRGNRLRTRAGIGQQLHETKLGIFCDVDEGRRRMRWSGTHVYLLRLCICGWKIAGKNAVLKI